MKVNIRNAAQLARAKEKYELVKKAWEKTLTSQSYGIGDEQLTRPQLARLEQEMTDLEEAIDAYEQYGTTLRRAKRAVPIG